MALAIGGCTIAELKARMTAKEARSWQRFLRLCGPVGYERSDWHFAAITQAVISSATGNVKPMEQFLLKFDTGKKQEDKQLENNCLQLAGMLCVNSDAGR